MKFNPSDLRRFEEFLDTDYLGFNEDEKEEENEEIESGVSLIEKKKGK